MIPTGAVEDAGYIRGTASGGMDFGYEGLEGKVPVDYVRGPSRKELTFVGLRGAGDGDDGFDA